MNFVEHVFLILIVKMRSFRITLLWFLDRDKCSIAGRISFRSWMKPEAEHDFFFSDPNANFFFKSDPLWKLITKMTHFYFLRFFFLSFSSFPPFQMAGMSPLPDMCQLVTGWDDVTFFFNFFCSFPPFQLAGLIFLFFFRFFGNNIYIIKIQIMINKKHDKY